jgi:predicted nucleic acid-binding protein
MKALLDTSTLIAAMLPDHVHHAPALAWLSRAKSGAFEFVCSAHSLAEVYAVLTRLPRTTARFALTPSSPKRSGVCDQTAKIQ